MADDTDAGISRQGISGLYDQWGNPAALASGWLQQVDPADKGRKRHRYFVLAPTYLAVFGGEDDADITEEGFLRGLTNADEERPEGAAVGVCISLADLASVSEEDTQLTIALKEGATVDGPAGAPVAAIVAECANAEIAQGWAGAVRAQWEGAASVEVPPRVPRSQQPQPKPAVVAAPAPAPAAAAAAASPASAASGSLSARAGAGFGAMMGSLRNLMASTGKEAEPVRLDSEYVALDGWGGRGVDLAAPRTGKKLWTDAGGREAAVLHGWLTKRNKSGLAKAGGLVAEKERYFVLTPTSLTFFPEERVAAVNEEGYLTGRAEGSTTGLFGKTGARLPLESVCEVRALQPNGKPLGRASAVGGKGRRAKDVEDEGDDGAGAGVGASAPSGTGGVALFEIDLGDAILTCNAHNAACRKAWVEATRKWVGIRKKEVDAEMFAIGEFERKKEAASAAYDSD